MLSSASGLGASARLCAEALKQADHRVFTCDVSNFFASGDSITFSGNEGTRDFVEGISIYHLNPPKLLPGILRSGLARYRRSFNIGYWAWELECLPNEWINGLRYVDAVFVPSTFCRAAVQRHTQKPVLVVPHPVREVPVAARQKSGIFRVLGIFNFGSSFERKNPMALVRAFRTAFADDVGVQLVLKTSQGERYQTDRDRLVNAVAGMSNVRLIDEVWPDDRMLGLIDSANVYLSLHRSEGFGLTIAEAIMREVPVVVTNWSGSTDFCSPEHAFAVDYELVSVIDDHTDYSEIGRARWADPSIPHAAAHLRTIRNAPGEARERARRLKCALHEQLCRSTYADAIGELVAEFGRKRPNGMRPASRTSTCARAS